MGVKTKDSLNHFRGRIRLQLQDAAGTPIGPVVCSENTVVTGGRRWVFEAIYSGGAGTAQVLSHMGIGTSTTAPATSDTALGSEATRKAIGTFTTTNLTSTVPNMDFIVSFATNEGNTTLGEAGIFNSSSGGTMFNRATFATIDKTTSNTLSLTYTVSN